MDERDDDHDARDTDLIRRTQDAFGREAEVLDAATRATLTAARRAALAELDGSVRGTASRWIPLGATAAVAIVAVGIALALRGPQSQPAVAVVDDPRATEVELLLGDDDPALYSEDPEFYDWATDDAG